MGKIIRNGIPYSGSSNSARSINYDNTNSGLEATTAQAAVDELNKKIEDIDVSGASNIVYLTKAQYDALPDSKLTDDVEYRITDAHTTNRIDAADVTYKEATVAAAIDELDGDLGGLRFGVDGEGNYGYFNSENVFIPFGSAVNKNDINIWLEVAGLDPSLYANLDELLEDEAAVRTLMTSKAAVDVLSQMNGEDLATIIKHRYAAKWINYREYAYNTLSSKLAIKAIMNKTGMYGMYITAESKCRPLVPVLTSNTGSDGGEVLYSSKYQDLTGIEAFDGINNTAWAASGTDVGEYLGYKFDKPTCVKRADLLLYVPSGFEASARVEGSNDLNDWTVVSDDIIITNEVSGNKEYSININSNSSYACYRLYFTTVSFVTTHTFVGVYKLQFYGYQLEGLIPTMTSNTTPSGEASASSEYSENYMAYCAFNEFVAGYAPSASDKFGSAYVQYAFDSPTVVKCITGKYLGPGTNDSMTYVYKVQASNNGTNFVTLVDSINMPEMHKVTINTNSDVPYKYYRFIYLSNSVNNIVHGSGVKFQLYGEPTLWEPKGLVPVMTSNTSPYGEAITNSEKSSCPAYGIFDGDATNSVRWEAVYNAEKPYIGYKFTVPTCVKAFEFSNTNAEGSVFAIDVEVYGRNGSTDTLITTMSLPIAKRDNPSVVEIDNDNYYEAYYIVILTTNTTGYKGLFSLQFYGRQLEALIPPMTTNTTPMGETFASSILQDGFYAYKAFNGENLNSGSAWISGATLPTVSSPHYIGYKSVKPLTVKTIIVSNRDMTNLADGDKAVFPIKDVIVQGSNDGSKWNDITNYTNTVTSSGGSWMIPVLSVTPYLYHRLLITSAHDTGYEYQKMVSVGEIQFYGTPDYESRTYIYDHGVEVIKLDDNTNFSGFTVVKPILNSDNITLESLSELKSVCAISTTDRIDLANYRVIFTNTVDGSDVRFGEVSDITSVLNLTTAKTDIDTNNHIIANDILDYLSSCLDINNISQPCYINIHSSEGRYAIIDTVWLE